MNCLFLYRRSDTTKIFFVKWLPIKNSPLALPFVPFVFFHHIKQMFYVFYTMILFRATSEGNHTIVTELLASGYRNLGAKDPDSRTALHLAVIHKQVHGIFLVLTGTQS